jgi:hypothetical protein
MQSSGNFSCSAFDKDDSNSVIKGTYKCYAATSNVQTGTSGSSGSKTGSGSSATKTGAASMSNVNGAVMGFAAALGGFALAL